jgi:ParB-like chromosome segregation protein Spo0J
VNESAGEHQNLHSDRTTTFVEDDVLGDEAADALEDFNSDAEEPAPRARAPREGLPSGFRMRHDAHYVDELNVSAPSIRQVAVSEIDRDRVPADAPPVSDALVGSVRDAGILQPLLVTPARGRFQVIDGVRRLQAAALAGLRHVPCIVHDIDEAAAMQMRERANVLEQTEDDDDVPAAIEPVVQGLPPGVAEDLAENLNLASAQAAVCARSGTGLKLRAAVDVLQADLSRAARLARAAAIVLDAPRLRRADVTARRIVERASAATAVTRRVAGVSLQTSIDDPEFRVPADVALVTQALAGTIDVMLGFTEEVRRADLDVDDDLQPSVIDHSLTLSVLCVKTRPAVIIELAQRAVSVEPELIGRFFDATSTLHPGGPSAALLLAAAARIVRAHGGRADVRRDGAVGCTITFVLPQSSSRC